MEKDNRIAIHTQETAAGSGFFQVLEKPKVKYSHHQQLVVDCLSRNYEITTNLISEMIKQESGETISPAYIRILISKIKNKINFASSDSLVSFDKNPAYLLSDPADREKLQKSTRYTPQEAQIVALLRANEGSLATNEISSMMKDVFEIDMSDRTTTVNLHRIKNKMPEISGDSLQSVRGGKRTHYMILTPRVLTVLAADTNKVDKIALQPRKVYNSESAMHEKQSHPKRRGGEMTPENPLGLVGNALDLYSSIPQVDIDMVDQVDPYEPTPADYNKYFPKKHISEQKKSMTTQVSFINNIAGLVSDQKRKIYRYGQEGIQKYYNIPADEEEAFDNKFKKRRAIEEPETPQVQGPKSLAEMAWELSRNPTKIRELRNKRRLGLL